MDVKIRPFPNGKGLLHLLFQCYLPMHRLYHRFEHFSNTFALWLRLCLRVCRLIQIALLGSNCESYSYCSSFLLQYGKIVLVVVVLQRTSEFRKEPNVRSNFCFFVFFPGNEKCCKAFNRLVNFIGLSSWRFTTMFTLILNGKIFYTPDTPQTRRVVKHANTFITQVFYAYR